VDTLTGLRWQAANNGADVSWAQANDYCRSLALDSYSDYRLPSFLELSTLLHGATMREKTPYEDFFSAGDSWTSSLMSSDLTHTYLWYWTGWWHNFAEPGTAPRAHVRCVRREQPKCLLPPNKRFTRASGTVHDACTGLTWTEVVSPTAGDHASRVAYCATLTLDNRTWRLPSFLELVSTLDTGREASVASAFVPASGCSDSTTLVANNPGVPTPTPYAVLTAVGEWESSEYQPTCHARCVSDAR
jgi:hypothetical protein